MAANYVTLETFEAWQDQLTTYLDRKFTTLEARIDQRFVKQEAQFDQRFAKQDTDIHALTDTVNALIQLAQEQSRVSADHSRELAELRQIAGDHSRELAELRKLVEQNTRLIEQNSRDIAELRHLFIGQSQELAELRRLVEQNTRDIAELKTITQAHHQDLIALGSQVARLNLNVRAIMHYIGMEKLAPFIKMADEEISGK